MILAIWNYFDATWCLVLGIVVLTGRSAMEPTFRILDRSWVPSPDIYGLGYRLLLACGAILFALGSYFLARGLWKLKNWARIVIIIFSVADLLPIGRISSSALWPISLFVTGAPYFQLLSHMVSFALVMYLLSSHVRSAFGVTTKSRKWIYVTGVVALVSLGISLRRSGPEFKAIKWHLRHGDNIRVNGITFPVYSWYAPVQDDEMGFSIWDEPGPLRPKDEYTMIEVSGCKRTDGATPDQLAENKIREYERTGYVKQSRLELQVGKQELDCMQESQFGRAIYCYGDGPISSVFFTGGDASLERFKQMMAQAR